MINTQSLESVGPVKSKYVATAFSKVTNKHVAYAGPLKGLIAFCKKHNLNPDDYS